MLLFRTAFISERWLLLVEWFLSCCLYLQILRFVMGLWASQLGLRLVLWTVYLLMSVLYLILILTWRSRLIIYKHISCIRFSILVSFKRSIQSNQLITRGTSDQLILLIFYSLSSFTVDFFIRNWYNFLHTLLVL